jgi:hypothetical protein
MRQPICVPLCLGLALLAVAPCGCRRRTSYQPTPFQGAITVDQAGNRVVVGSFRSRLGIGNNALSSVGGSDIFVAKIRRDASNVWQPRLFGSTGDDAATGVVLDAEDAIIVGGTFQGEVSFGAVRLASHARGPNERAVFVAKLDPNDGGVLWATSVGLFDGIATVSVAVEADGRILAGISLGGTPRKEGDGEGQFLMGDKLIARELTPTGVLLRAEDLLATTNTCAHSPCVPGDGLALGCDPCVTAYCDNVNPGCCMQSANKWTTACQTGFSQYCHRRCGCDYCTVTPNPNPWPMDPGACPPYTSSICSNWMPSCCDYQWTSACVDLMKTRYHKCN